jgi:hypothetical protein
VGSRLNMRSGPEKNTLFLRQRVARHVRITVTLDSLELYTSQDLQM